VYALWVLFPARAREYFAVPAGALLVVVLGLVPSVALASNDWLPGPDTAETGAYACEGVIDAPATGGVVAANQSFHVSGWIVDPTAQGWSGFDDVHAISAKLARAAGC
jgi:hypothetical protein